MRGKKPLLFLMVGLLAISFALPAMAQTRPSYMIDPADVPGWYLYKEESITEEWNWSAGGLAGFFDFSVWYQIWINNQSGKTDGEAWTNATAAMALLAIDLDMNLDRSFLGISLWDMVSSLLAGVGCVEKSVPGLGGCFMWNISGFWAAIGYNGQLLFVALGWGSQTPPGNPFGGSILAIPKAPADSTTSESDILGLMGAQGQKFPGIPGFELITVFLAVVVLTGVIFLLRKDQLSLLKN